jgi:hypothetical protein
MNKEISEVRKDEKRELGLSPQNDLQASGALRLRPAQQ